MYKAILQTSPEVFRILEKEDHRQHTNVELIASENFCSRAVREAMGSCFTNKYCEGYPDVPRLGLQGRYYGGCQYADELEEYCIKRWKEVFNTDYHANVQPHSGSQANAAAYAAVLKPGDTILSMDLNNGGHLTHGSKVNFSGKLYNVVFYNTDSQGFIDYDDVAKKVAEYHPKLVLAGASAYPRIIDFERFHRIIEGTGALFMVDMAHIAGLIAAGVHPTPFGYADIITTTTHKTLRGPRGGMIFCKPELAKKVDSAVFPGNQGGPLMHIIAAKAVCADEALMPAYKTYIQSVVDSARYMAQTFKDMGYDVVTGGTDNHLFLLDFSKTHPNLTGLDVQNMLDIHHITLNKNCVPNEQRSPKLTSGVRIGTAPMTTKGWDAQQFVNCAHYIDEIISGGK